MTLGWLRPELLAMDHSHDSSMKDADVGGCASGCCGGPDDKHAAHDHSHAGPPVAPAGTVAVHIQY